jgi:hypothetical protein
LLVVDRCFHVQVWGTPWPLHTLVSSFYGIVSLDTLESMCYLSLGLLTNTLSVCLFVCVICLFFFSVKKKKEKFAMLLLSLSYIVTVVAFHRFV